MSTTKLLPWEHRGAVHSDLAGGSSPLRFRPRRLSTAELSFNVDCTFLIENEACGPYRVLDLSPTGIAVNSEERGALPPGSYVNDLRLSHRGKTIWEGEAQAVYQVDGPSARLG